MSRATSRRSVRNPDAGTVTPPLTILILSPQPWNGFKVSKHHYAATLGRRGIRVVFVETRVSGPIWGRITLEPADIPNVSVLRYAGKLLRWLEFRARHLYTPLSRIKARQIVRRLGRRPDIVWDMDNLHHFPDLAAFGAGLALYHPVDAGPAFDAAGKHADLVFSLSEELIPAAMRETLPWHLFPHGLNAIFAEHARQLVEAAAQGAEACAPAVSRRRVVGYMGNLDAKGLDWPVIEAMARSHPQVEFRLIGPYADARNEDPERGAPIGRLARLPNVRLIGYLSNAEVLRQADEIDIWLLCYDPVQRPDAMINSHKVLEYLATGKPVLSHWMQVHRDERLVCMPPGTDNQIMPALLQDMLARLPKLASPEAMRYRASYALQHSYERLMDRMLAVALPLLPLPARARTRPQPGDSEQDTGPQTHGPN